ncbi:MAG: 30S ribosomal protein THX [Isosphaeraceae bacterium]
MGKGDRRSKRGKIFRGTFGKRRPKPEKERKKAVAFAAAAAAAAAAPTS